LRYFIEFSYNGAHYFGYQIQPDAITIQQVLEEKLSMLLRDEIKLTGAGRTDTGVHAKKAFSHFDTEKTPDENFVYRLNSFLPADIAIHRIFPVRPDLHARFSAKYRTYEYFISTVKDPFSSPLAWQFWRKELDIEKMNEACKILYQYSDFTSFAKMHGDNKTNLCKVFFAEWEKNGSEIKFTVTADRFLRNMVRAIVGTMVEVGTGKLQPQDMHRVITDKNRNSAGGSAPAHGLYLADVGYDF